MRALRQIDFDLKDTCIFPPSYVPTRINFGRGVSPRLSELIGVSPELRDCRRPVLLTGHQGPKKPWLTKLTSNIRSRVAAVIENTVCNPTFDSIDSILREVRRVDGDAVIAVGGGSVLDTGKIVANLLYSGLSTREAALQKPASGMIAAPIVAIPTTCGTGAEVTPFATAWDPVSRQKYSLSGPRYYPAIAIIDPDFLVSLPSQYLAGTGLDALAHGMESFWSVNATEESRGYGLRAVELIGRYLRSLVHDPSNPILMEKVSLASIYAGLSIAGAQTTISHAISYPLTSRYGIHHGHACALSLGALLRFNAGVCEDDCQDERGSNVVRSGIAQLCYALNANDAAAGEREILSLIRSVGLKTFNQYDRISLPVVADDVMHYDRFHNNPRRMSRLQLETLLTSLQSPTFNNDE